MKNATKLVWLMVFLTSSIVFAFGQSANQMTLEQKVAYDQSVVVADENGIDLSVPPSTQDGKVIILNEGFPTGIPGSWSQIQYSGAGIWEWYPAIPQFASYDPPNNDGYYALTNSDYRNTWVYDVGLFTPSMDMSGSDEVWIDADRNFQDYAGDGLGELRVYSGGTGPGNLETVLWSQGFDDPSAGVHMTYMIDPSVYADPSNVYLEFYYSTEGGTYAWGFSLDNVVVDLTLAPGEVYGYVFNGAGLTIAGATVACEAEGVFTTSGPDGSYSLFVPGGLQDVIGFKDGYNVTLHTLNVPPLGTVNQDFILTAPTMIISPTNHEYTLNPNEYYTAFTGILNTGDGPLEWNATIEFLTDKASSVSITAGQYQQGNDPVSLGQAPAKPAGTTTEKPYNGPIDGSGMGYICAPSDDNLYTMDMNGYGTTLVGSTVTDGASGDFLNGDASTLYVAGDWGSNLYAVDVATGAATFIAPITGHPDGVTGMACDRTSNTMYVVGTNISASYVGVIDVTTGVVTPYPNITNAPGLIDIAINGNGDAYAWCLVNDNTYSIDLSTGVATLLGPLGYDANYGQGGNWNQDDGEIYLSAYNNAAGAELRIMDQTTGATAYAGSLPASQCGAFGFPGTGSGAAGGWLTLDYYTNTVAPGGGLDNVPTNFNAAGMVAGEVHTAVVTFESTPDVGTIAIPCTLIVAGDPLTPPTDLVVELVDDITGETLLTWTWDTDAFQYFLIKRDGGIVGTTTDTFYTDFLPDYGTYCYTVQAFYDEGSTAPTNEECVEWPLPEVFVDPDYHYAEVWVDHQYLWTTTIYNLGIGTLSYEVTQTLVCEHSIELWDTFGDGWNGGSLDVFVDGTPVLTGITLSSGSGPAVYTFMAESGLEISTTYTPGGWPYENYYYIYDGDGNEIGSDGVGGGTPSGITCTAFCSSGQGFVVDIDPATGFVSEGSSQDVDITWDATGFAPDMSHFETLFVLSNDPVNPVVPIDNEMYVVVPAQFAGVVTECESGAPLAGVTVTAGPFQTMTNALGEYSLYVDEEMYDVFFELLGWETVEVEDSLALSGVVTPIDVCLYESPYPVPFVTATVEYPDEDFCTVEWSLPEGPYEVSYDDGFAEDLFAWTEAGGESAVKFTPAGYPANIFGGRVFVGDGLFPAGSWIGSQFAIIIYADEDGMPGAQLDSIGVTVNNYGWVEFFGLDVTIEEGDFFMSMYQLADAPNTAPLGIDDTFPLAYRSYQRSPILGGWQTSVYQDFMMRAYINGSQTDLLTEGSEVVRVPKVDNTKASKHYITQNNTPFVTTYGVEGAGTTGMIEGYDVNEDVLYYTVARLSDFDPVLGPEFGTLTVLNNVTETSYIDNDFSALPMGWYAYAVQVAYSSGMLSPWTYSNIVGRDMDVAITFEVTLCDGTAPEDVEITMQGVDYPSTLYTGVTDETGIYTFEQVWKGAYEIEVFKIGYETYEWDQVFMQDETISLIISEKRYPVRNLWVDPLTSYLYWDPPLVVALDEGFEGAAWPPEGWQATSNSIGWFLTTDGSSTYWTIPAWDSQYACANDDAAGSGEDGSVDYLITPPLDLREVDTYALMFDSYYDGTYGQLASVEYSYDAGANWTILYGLTPNPGSWAEIEVDLAGFSGMGGTAPIWFAFHSDDAGDWASGWAIDNVLFANGETDPIQYHVFLDGALDGLTDTTWYQFAYLTYGVTYTACVAAEYSCGLSPEVCIDFTSTFLLPPRNLDGETFDDAVHVWWEPPITPGDDDAVSNSVYDPNFVPEADVAETIVTGTVVNDYKSLGGNRALLYDNGPLANSIGTGAGGADESILQDGLTIYGFGAQNDLPNIMADDFEVTGTWNISDFTFYGYQTGSGPPSTLTGVYMEIYDGEPGAGGSVIYGSQSTNAMIETDWSGIYRNNDGPGGSTNRPIMYTVAGTPGLVLTPGTYWVAFSFTGSGTSGPWAPPITISGVTNTGNGIQYTESAGTWGPAISGSDQQGMPFLINGSGGGGGVIPDNLIGYNLYRDMNNIAYVPYNGEDTTHYYDYELEPLCYAYDVSAVYDLTPYGFPGETGESAWEGTFDVCVEFGWPLTFIEDWNTGSFDPNLWSHGDNWVVNGQFGNPYPCAEFKWDPLLFDYESSLTSYPIDGVYHPGTSDPYIDGRIYFDFDLALEDNSMSGDEMMYVEIWDGGMWYPVASFSNADGSFDWTTYSFEITNHAFGKIFKVRFTAAGTESQDIISWFVDNIIIYRECDAPRNLTADGIDEVTIELNWNAPAGSGGGGGGGGEWLHWDSGVNEGNAIGFGGAAVWSVASRWEPSDLTAFEGYYITHIRFFAGGSAGGSTYSLRVWEGANAATLIYSEDVPTVLIGDWNEIELATPVAIDVTQELWFGYTTEQFTSTEYPAGCDAGPAVANYGDLLTADGVTWESMSLVYGLDYNWNLQAYVADMTDGVAGNSVPLVDDTEYKASGNDPVLNVDGGINNAVSFASITERALTGYNVYWNEDGAGYIFAAFTEDTTFTHVVEEPFPVGSTQCYYVTAVYEDCEPASEEACVVATGIEDPALVDGIAVYPNPARDILNITSSTDITHVTVMNYVGQVVYNQKVVEDNTLELNVAGYETGVYIVKVETTAGIVTKKITVAH